MCYCMIKHTIEVNFVKDWYTDPDTVEFDSYQRSRGNTINSAAIRQYIFFCYKILDLSINSIKKNKLFEHSKDFPWEMCTRSISEHNWRSRQIQVQIVFLQHTIESTLTRNKFEYGHVQSIGGKFCGKWKNRQK